MVNALMGALGKLVDEFTWRRFVGLLVTIALAGAVLVIYERTTSSFRLARIEKAAEVLSLLKESSVAPAADSALVSMHAYLVSELEAAIRVKPLSLQLPQIGSPPPPNAALLKTLASAAPWLAFALFSLFGALKGKEDSRSALWGFLFIAAAFAWFGYLVPTAGWPWLNLAIIPALFFVGTIALVLSIAVIVDRKSNKRSGVTEA